MTISLHRKGEFCSNVDSCENTAYLLQRALFRLSVWELRENERLLVLLTLMLRLRSK